MGQPGRHVGRCTGACLACVARQQSVHRTAAGGAQHPAEHRRPDPAQPRLRIHSVPTPRPQRRGVLSTGSPQGHWAAGYGPTWPRRVAARAGAAVAAAIRTGPARFRDPTPVLSSGRRPPAPSVRPDGGGRRPVPRVLPATNGAGAALRPCTRQLPIHPATATTGHSAAENDGGRVHGPGHAARAASTRGRPDSRRWPQPPPAPRQTTAAGWVAGARGGNAADGPCSPYAAPGGMRCGQPRAAVLIRLVSSVTWL